MKLSKIKKEVDNKVLKILCVEVAKELEVDDISILGVNLDRGTLDIKKIIIDGHTITNVIVDRYSNLDCSIGKKFPIEYLHKFGRIVSEIWEMPEYKGRANYGLHVEYYKKYP